MVSFPISLKPSAKACKIPHIPVILGPLLLCIEAKTFLSYKVKKAIDNIIGKIIGKNLNQSKFNINKIIIKKFNLKKNKKKFIFYK